jgi:hypothetical protein
MNQAGKGDKPRPVDKKKYNENFDQIDWSAHKNKKNDKKN